MGNVQTKASTGKKKFKILNLDMKNGNHCFFNVYYNYYCLVMTYDYVKSNVMEIKIYRL